MIVSKSCNTAKNDGVCLTTCHCYMDYEYVTLFPSLLKTLIPWAKINLSKPNFNTCISGHQHGTIYCQIIQNIANNLNMNVVLIVDQIQL